MVTVADFGVYDRDGQLTAVAEVKSKVGTSGDWAARLRQNILAQTAFPGVNFFLLMTPDRFYLWKKDVSVPDVARPTYEGDSRALLAPYFTRSQLDLADISGLAFELVVAAWLADLVRSDAAPKKLPDDQRWLQESGFLGAVKNGRVEFEVAA